MSAARKLEERSVSAPARTTTRVVKKKPATRKKPVARKVVAKRVAAAPAWRAPLCAGLIGWMFASVLAFSFVEVARRETRHWRAVEEQSERDIRALQASMQDDYFRRLDQHAASMGMVASGRVELPEPTLVAANTKPVVKPQ